MVKKFFKKVKEDFLDSLYPPDITCYCCGDELRDEKFICKSCSKNFVEINCFCSKCGNVVNDQTTICDDCKNKTWSFTKAISVFEYCGSAQKLIYKLKYNGEKYIAKIFAQPLVKRFLEANFSKIDLVTCIPLNEKRQKERSYNQAEVISREFVKELSKSNILLNENYNLVSRVKNTPSQTSLTKKEREENLKGAFKLNCKVGEIKGKNILIIDDIFTTGATMEEISKVFKKGGVANVYCLTVCHTNIDRLKAN